MDNGLTVQTYSDPFIISAPGKTTLQVKSIDKLGNEEIPQTIEVEIAAAPSPTPTPTPTSSSTPASSSTRQSHWDCKWDNWQIWQSIYGQMVCYDVFKNRFGKPRNRG